LPALVPLLKELHRQGMLGDVAYASNYLGEELNMHLCVPCNWDPNIEFLYAVYPSGRIDVYGARWPDTYDDGPRFSKIGSLDALRLTEAAMAELCTGVGIEALRVWEKMKELRVAAAGDLNAADRSGHTCLHDATMAGMKEAAEVLISHGAEVNARAENGATPLHYALRKGNVEVAELLIRHGADVNASANDGRTPLSMAEEKGHRELVNLLKGVITP
jgi:hypothetical protein